MKVQLSFIVCLVCSTTLAQDWTVSNLHVAIGSHSNRVNAATALRILELAPVDLTEDQTENYTRYHNGVESSHYTGLKVTLTPENPSENAIQRELRFGLDIFLGRTGQVAFENESSSPIGPIVDRWTAQLVEDEVGVSFDHLWRKHINQFSFYSGIGGSIGATMGGDVKQTRMMYYKLDEGLIDPIDDFSTAYNTILEARNSFYFRTVVPVGVEMRVGQFGVGAEYGFGAAVNKFFGNSSVMRSNMVSLRVGMLFS